MYAMKLSTRMMLLAILTALAAGCKGEPPLAETPPVDVVVCKPVTEKIEDWDVYTGEVEAVKTIQIRSMVRGKVLEVLFKNGGEVKAGETLFVIDSSRYQADLSQAKGQLTSWEAKRELAKERIKLYEPLVKAGTVAREELLSAIAAEGEAKGGIDTANGKLMEAKVNIEDCKISSLVAGRIGKALIPEGNIINSGGGETLLATVVSIDPMYVKFNVNENALRGYLKVFREKAEKEGKKLPAKDDKDAPPPPVPLEMALLGDDTFTYKGVVDFVDNKVDPGTSAQLVYGRFDNPRGPDGRRPLTAGMFARVRVTIVEPYPAILLADRAILTDQSLKYVLVVNKAKKNTVERMDIVASTRLQENGLRAVEAGLKGDEWVIVEGVGRVRPGMTVNPKDEAMPRRPVGK